MTFEEAIDFKNNVKYKPEPKLRKPIIIVTPYLSDDFNSYIGDFYLMSPKTDEQAKKYSTNGRYAVYAIYIIDVNSFAKKRLSHQDQGENK
jgi:hypothetical protein